MHYKTVEFGFEYGAATVTRNCSDEKKGWVCMSLVTKKADIEMYVTKTGKVRIFKGGKELK